MSKNNLDKLNSTVLNLALNLGLRVERLSPLHAVDLQNVYKPGTEHIAEYFAWAKDAYKWSTKECLFWIQDSIQDPFPSEYFVFFSGKEMIGIGILGCYFTGKGGKEDARHTQMAYWVGKNYLGNGFGDRIVRIMEYIAFLFRNYEFMHLIHDSNNRKTSHMAQRLGYKFEEFYDSEILAINESGVYYSWVKANPFVSNVRTKNRSSQVRNQIRTH